MKTAASKLLPLETGRRLMYTPEERRAHHLARARRSNPKTNKTKQEKRAAGMAKK